MQLFLKKLLFHSSLDYHGHKGLSQREYPLTFSSIAYFLDREKDLRIWARKAKGSSFKNDILP